MNANLKRFASLTGVAFLALAGLTVAVRAQQRCIPPPSGIVGWWPGDGNYNDITAAHDGMAVGPVPFAKGEVGQAFSFSGVGGGYVNVPGSGDLNITGPLTVDAWIYLDALNQNQYIISKYDRTKCSGAFATYQLLVNSSNLVEFAIGDGTNVYELVSTRRLTTGLWYHIVGAYDGTDQIIYINGTQDALASIGSKTLYVNPNDPVQIGFANSTCATYYFTGLIDEVQVFNRALSAAEIQAIYNAGSAGECKPAGGCGASSSEFAYVTNALSNSISVYRVDGNTGALTPTSVTADSSEPESVGIDPLGRFAYVGNAAATGGTPSISVYAIDPNTGALTEVSGSPFPTGLVPSPNGLAVHPTGNFLYLANDQPAVSGSHVSAFSIDSQTGALTQIPGSPYQTGNNTWSVTTDPAGKFLFVADGSSCRVLVYGIDAATGALTPVPGSPFHSGCDALIDVVDPTGRFLYVSNEISNTISGYKIDPQTAALTPLPGSPFAVPGGSGPVGIAVDPLGHFLYSANSNSTNVSGYAIDSNTGVLSPLPGSPFAGGTSPRHATTDSTGSFLYVPNIGSNDVSVYAINTQTGALTPVAGSPFSAGTYPAWIALARECKPSGLSVTPNTAPQGQKNLSVALTDQGTNWVQGTTTASFGAGITVVSLTVNSATSATAVLSIDPTASTGARTVTLTTGTEVDSLASGFTVTGGTPAVVSVNPNSGQQGQQNLSLNITGQFSNWVQGTTTANFGAGIAVVSLTVNSLTGATAVINIDPTAAVGPRTVALTTGNEVATLPNGFTVATPQSVPDLTITKTHTGNFTQGQIGATYTIDVTNSGTGPTSGPVVVTDTLPAVFTATSISGTGWSCILSTLACTRSDALMPGASYPAITVVVNVASSTATSIPITNAGFEADVLGCQAGPNCFDSGNLPGWSGGTTFKPSTGPGGEFPNGVPEGVNVAAIGCCQLRPDATQDLGFAPAPNTTYTLTVSVGQRTDSALTGYIAELLVGTTSVASTTSPIPAPGTFIVNTLTYNSGPSPGPGHLVIHLGSIGNGQVDFDKVTLVAAHQGSNVPPSVTNSATVSGGGELNTANDTANDVTTINPAACVAPPAGLVGWWPGDGNANDIVGGANGTVHGIVVFNQAHKVGSGGFLFNGSSFVEVPGSPTLEPSHISVAAWVQASSVGPYHYILAKGVTPADASYALYTGPSGGLSFYISNGTTAILSPDAGPGIWNGFHFVVGTFDGSTIRLFVDGVQVGSGTPASTAISYVTSQRDLFIGTFAGDASGQFGWPGAVDEVQIFDRALSASEIQSIYAAGSAGECKSAGACVAPPSGLVSWWPGDGNANDIIGGNNGSPVGGVTFTPTGCTSGTAGCGMVAQAFSLNGSDSVKVPDTPALDVGSGEVTVDAWINAPPGNTFRIILSKSEPSGNYQGYAIRLADDNRVEFWASDCATAGCGWTEPGAGGSRQPVRSLSIVADGTYHHVAGARLANGTEEIFVDGVLENTFSEPAFNSSTTNALYIGQLDGNPQSTEEQLWFTGQIDEVQVFNRALSASEIRAIYNAAGAGECKRPPIPANLTVVTGDNQSGTVGQALDQPLVVKLSDQNGAAVTGAQINFVISTGGGTFAGGGTQLAVTTDVQGLASVFLSLGPSAGANTVTATANGYSASPITFTATAIGTITPTSGDGQVGAVGTALPSPLVVTVAGVSNAAVPNRTVLFAITAGTGSLSATTVNTDAQGHASTTLTLGSTPGTTTVTATSAGLTGSPVSFTATAQPASAITVNPNAVAFGGVPITTSSTKTVTLTNTGTNPLTVSSISATGLFFALEGLPPLPVVLAPSRTASFNATFAPQGTISSSGSVVITSNAATSPTILPLTGNGIPPPLPAATLITVATDHAIYHRGQPVQISGELAAAGGVGVPNIAINVQLAANGAVRTLTAYTAADGTYRSVFQPGSADGGAFTVTAVGTSGGATQTATAGFRILGLLLSPNSVNQNLLMGATITLPFDMQNLGDAPLNGLTSSVTVTPAGAVSVTLPQTQNSLAPGSSTTIPVTLSAPAGNPPPGPVMVAVNYSGTDATSGLTETGSTTIVLTLQPSVSTPVLLPQIAYVGVNPGTSFTGTLVVRNDGFAPMNASVTLQNPGAISWVTLGNANLGTIAPGDLQQFQVLISPPANVPVGKYTVLLNVNGGSSPLQGTLNITVTQQTLGSAAFVVSDDIGTKVGGASVTLYGKNNGKTFQGVTDNTGQVLISGVDAGDYSYVVVAPTHDPLYGSVIVTASATAQVNVLLSYDVVTLTFIVTPTTIVDQYNVTLNITYSTTLPKPALQVVPYSLDFSFFPEDAPNGRYACSLSITNTHPTAQVRNLVVDASQLDVSQPVSQRLRVFFANGAQVYQVGTLAGQATATVPCYAALDSGTVPSHSVGNIVVQANYDFSLDGQVLQGTTTTNVPVTYARPSALTYKPVSFIYDEKTDPKHPVLKYDGDGFVYTVTSNRTPVFTLQKPQSAPFNGHNLVAFTETQGGADLLGVINLNQSNAFWHTDFDSKKQSLLGNGDTTTYDISTLDGGLTLEQALASQVAINPDRVLNNPTYLAFEGQWADGASLSPYLIPVRVTTVTQNSITTPRPPQAGPTKGCLDANDPQCQDPRDSGGAPLPNQGGQILLAIDQTIRLERQAFNAVLGIGAHATLTNTVARIQIRDAKGNDASSQFFVLVTGDPLGATGGGTVAGQTAVSWQLIPNAGAGGTSPQGTQYQVQALLSYMVQGVAKSAGTQVVTITVLPSPKLTVAYTAPFVVMAGKDAKIRVTLKNVGFGTAHNLSIQSMQPRVVSTLPTDPLKDNPGPDVSFNITGSSNTADGSGFQAGNLTISFGDVAPGASVSGYWTLQASQRGFFISISSTFSHTDYQGIALDPLILPPTTTLVPAIGGIVTTDSGQAIPGLTVDVSQAGTIGGSDQTDISGGYYIQDLVPGNYLEEVRDLSGSVVTSKNITVLGDQATNFIDFVIAGYNPTEAIVFVNSTPAGESFTADGASYTTPHSFKWKVGSTHTLGAPNIIGGSTFVGWDDGETGTSGAPAAASRLSAASAASSGQSTRTITVGPFGATFNQLFRPSAEVNQYKRTQITTDAIDHKWPAMNNLGDMVWSQKDSKGNWQVFEEGPSTGNQRMPITSDQHKHERPVISDDGTIAWFQDTTGGGLGYAIVRRDPSGALSTVEFSTRNHFCIPDPNTGIETCQTPFEHAAGKNFGIASNGQTISYFTFYRDGQPSNRPFDVSGVGKLPEGSSTPDVFLGFDSPDINSDASPSIVYSDDFTGSGNIYLATAAQPLAQTIIDGPGLGSLPAKFPHITDGPNPEVAYVKNKIEVTHWPGKAPAKWVDTGLWADISRPSGADSTIVYQRVVGGFSEVFAAKAVHYNLATTGGDQQSAMVTTALTNPLVVTVTDQQGNAVSGIDISFSISLQPPGAKGAALNHTDATTVNDGTASAILTLGDTQGRYQVTASCSNQTCSPGGVIFTVAATPYQLTKGANSGDLQPGVGINRRLPNPLVVKVADPTGNPVPSATVSFALAQHPFGAIGTSLSTATAGPGASVTTTTGPDGTASAQLTSGNQPGQYQVTVSCPNKDCAPNVVFTEIAQNLLGVVPSSVDQTADPNQHLRMPLAVRTVDGAGNPNPNVNIVFSVTRQPPGSTVQPPVPGMTATSAMSGTASTQFTMGDTRGEYQVTASCPDNNCVPNSVVFRARTPIVIEMLDPVTSLLDGPMVTKVTDTLATEGRVVQRIAADGVAEIVLRMTTNLPGEQLDLTFSNGSGRPNEDGGLADPLGTGTFQPTISVTAKTSSSSGPMAFATYQAPLDFARSGGQDDNQGSRTIIIHVQSHGTDFSEDVSVKIVRPPVVLVHGFWSSLHTWDHFVPLSPNLVVFRANYSPFETQGVNASAVAVLDQMDMDIDLFKGLQNAAAVQADVVVHSMGGLVVRALVPTEGFLVDGNYGQGMVHKLITLDTPHLGSPLAERLLMSNDSCQLAFNGTGHPIGQQIEDMVPESLLLLKLNSNQFIHYSSTTPVHLKTHVITAAADDAQTTAANKSFVSNLSHIVCPSLLPAGGFKELMNGDSDLIVPVPSQLASNSGLGQQVPATSFPQPGKAGLVHTIVPFLIPKGPDVLNRVCTNSGPKCTAVPASPTVREVINLLNAQVSASFGDIAP